MIKQSFSFGSLRSYKGQHWLDCLQAVKAVNVHVKAHQQCANSLRLKFYFGTIFSCRNKKKAGVVYATTKKQFIFC